MGIRKSTAILAGICAAATLFAVSCRRGPRRLNLVVVTLDTLRADRLGCYGYRGAETPHLDALARRGALFESAIAQAPLTAPSHASLFTGQNPPVHKVRDTGGFVLAPEHVTLAEILQRQGWDTAAFVGSAVLKKSFGFSRGFALYDDRMPRGAAEADVPERRAGEVVDRAVRWLDAQKGKPYFLWVHVFDPHSPYDPPPPYREKYAGRLYDGEVAYTDREIGRLLDAVARKAPAERTLIAVLSDHGESLAEHGEYSHGVFLYDATLRIVFLMAGPGVPAGIRVRPQARGVDLLPTVLDLLRIRAPEKIAGVSLAPAFNGKPTAAPYAYSETLFPRINMGWTELRAIRTSRWKYIRAPKPELYDLADDPGERSNVIAGHTEEARDLETRLRDIAGPPGGEKVETAMVDASTMQQLKSLGYAAGFARQVYTLTGQGIDPKDRLEVLKLLYDAVSPDAGTPAVPRTTLLRRALALDPGNLSVYLHLGDEYQKQGAQKEAMRLYQEGLRNGVRTAWIYSRLGHLYVQQGNRDEAIAAYETAAQMNPSDCDSLSDLGLTYLDAGRVRDAERVFQWCLATGEEHAAAHNGLGLVAVRRQDALAARTHFEKAVELDPDLLEAQLNLCRVYRNIGANTRARACLETFLAKASPARYGRLIPAIRAELEALR